MSEKKKILVIDDDEEFVEFCRMVLEQDGYDVAMASSGQEGRDQAAEAPPDLILVDMMMETWSEGANVISDLRGSPETKAIPIILISAVNLRNTFEESMPEACLNVNAYIVKPIAPDDLLKHVKQLVNT